MKNIYRVKLSSGEWIADFACLETAQRFVGQDETLTLSTVCKQTKRNH